MDENHDGAVTQSEFIEAGIFFIFIYCLFLFIIYNLIIYHLYFDIFDIAGVHGAEEVQHDADVEDHRRVHRRGHLQQPPAATTTESSRGTPDLVQISKTPDRVQDHNNTRTRSSLS